MSDPWRRRRGIREHLFFDKLGFDKKPANKAMMHGQVTEGVAVADYCKNTGQQVRKVGFVTWQSLQDQQQSGSGTMGSTLESPSRPSSHPDWAWIGGSPDGLVLPPGLVLPSPSTSSEESNGEADVFGDGFGARCSTTMSIDKCGILEIKSPMYKDINADTNWKYMFQVQGLMEMLDTEWADLYVYRRDQGAVHVHVQRDREFWGDLVPLLRDFWWGHYHHARQALLKAGYYSPEPGPPLATREADMKLLVQEFVPAELEEAQKLYFSDWAQHMYHEASTIKSFPPR
eukprot:gene4880-34643_t